MMPHEFLFPFLKTLQKMLLRQLNLMQTQLMKRVLFESYALRNEVPFNLVKSSSAPRRKALGLQVGNLQRKTENIICPKNAYIVAFKRKQILKKV